MTKDEIIQFFGDCTKTARALGISNSTITRWKPSPPIWHQNAVEVISKGKLKADIIKPKVRNKSTTTKACFNIPNDSFKKFKKYCCRRKYPMSLKISELIDSVIR